MTPAGPVAAGRLRVGDRIITYDAGAQRLGHVAVCEVPTSILLRISPGILDPWAGPGGTSGTGAPDLVIAAGQILLVRDWRAQAMFRQKAMLVAAARMVDGTYIAPHPGHGTTRLITLGFAGAARIVQLGGGIEVQSARIAAPALSPSPHAR